MVDCLAQWACSKALRVFTVGSAEINVLCGWSPPGGKHNHVVELKARAECESRSLNQQLSCWRPRCKFQACSSDLERGTTKHTCATISCELRACACACQIACSTRPRPESKAGWHSDVQSAGWKPRRQTGGFRQILQASGSPASCLGRNRCCFWDMRSF